MKKIIITLLALGTLAACNSGSSVNNNDVQNISGTQGSYPNQFQITAGTATGCRAIAANGSCNITITYFYSGSTNYGGPLTTSTLNGYSSTIASCLNVTTMARTCTFNITNTNGNVSAVQNVYVIANGIGGGIYAFNLGGGY